MTTYTYAEYPIWQFYNNGEPVAGGQLFCYQAGTTTKQAAYADTSGTPISNPIILDSQGRPTTNGTTITPVFLQVGQSYKFVLAASTDTDPPSSPIWTADNQSTTTLITNIANTAFGQCILTVTSTSTITLSPFNGNLLTINDAVYQIPNAGITLSNSGLVVNTPYYIYAFMNGTTMTLEASETPYAVGSTARIRVKTGDTTRTLVGLIVTDNSNHFVDSDIRRSLLNWFNRYPKSLLNIFTTNRSTASSTLVEVNTEIRAYFTSWDSDVIPCFIQGALNPDTNSDVGTALLVDGVGLDYAYNVQTVLGTKYATSYASSYYAVPNETLHYLTFAAKVSAGTLSLLSDVAAGTVCAVGATLLI